MALWLCRVGGAPGRRLHAKEPNLLLRPRSATAVGRRRTPREVLGRHMGHSRRSEAARALWIRPWVARPQRHRDNQRGDKPERYQVPSVPKAHIRAVLPSRDEQSMKLKVEGGFLSREHILSALDRAIARQESFLQSEEMI